MASRPWLHPAVAGGHRGGGCELPLTANMRVPFRSLVAVLVLGSTGLGCLFLAPTHRGPETDHFDGRSFFTPIKSGAKRPGLLTFAKWRLTRRQPPWTPYREYAPGPRPPYQVGPGQMRVTFINHATTLIQLDGVNILTDPIYSWRCSPFDFVGPRRTRPPGTRFEDLPRIDAVVISHNHYDHLDVPTLKRIVNRWPSVRIFAGLGNRSFLEQQGLPGVTELDWWESRELKGITVRSVPSQHGSGRALFDLDGTLWTAWVLEGKAGRAYFAGDTGYGPHFAKAARRRGPMRLAVLPVGAFEPPWLMGPVHESPPQAVEAARDLHAAMAVPIHFGTFELADDGQFEPVQLLEAALADAGVNFQILGFGEGRDVP